MIWAHRNFFFTSFTALPMRVFGCAFKQLKETDQDHGRKWKPPSNYVTCNFLLSFEIYNSYVCIWWTFSVNTIETRIKWGESVSSKHVLFLVLSFIRLHVNLKWNFRCSRFWIRRQYEVVNSYDIYIFDKQGTLNLICFAHRLRLFSISQNRSK